MVSSRTFSERVYNCSKFKEENNYAKIIKRITMEAFDQYINDGKNSSDNSFFGFLCEKLVSNTAKLSKVLKIDKEDVEDVLIKYAENISAFNTRFTFINNTTTDYIYRYKINGSIIGQTIINGVTYNIDISFSNATDTFYEMYYYKLNFYLYNETYNYSNDSIVYIASNDTMYIIKYDKDDYTINKGFLDYNIKSRAVRPGHQCIYCSVKNCKPLLISNIDRFIT